MPTENRSSNTESKIQPLAQHPEGRRERFQKWVLATKHPVLGYLDGTWLARGDDREGYADKYVQGLWVAYKEFGQPAPQPHPDPIAWMVGTAFWWTKEEAERDAAETGLQIVGLGPMAGATPADLQQVEPVALPAKFAVIRTLAERACGTSKDSPAYRAFMSEINPTLMLDLTADPAEVRKQGEPVALPAHHDADLRSPVHGYARGWNACLDEIAKLGPLYSRPVQGEPVAWLARAVDADGTTYRQCVSTSELTERDAKFAWGEGVMNRCSVVITQLGPLADPAEVERLREENRVLQKQLGDRWADIDALNQSNEEYPAAAVDSGMQNDNLRARLAEAQALLSSAYKDMESTIAQSWCISCHQGPEDDGVITHDPSCTFCAIEMALSASAEPSALPDPLGCNACAHTECGRFDGPRQVECRAMADNACARPGASS